MPMWRDHGAGQPAGKQDGGAFTQGPGRAGEGASGRKTWEGACGWEAVIEDQWEDG